MRARWWGMGLAVTLLLAGCTAPGPVPTAAPEPEGECPDGTAFDDGLCVADTDEAAEAAALVRSMFEAEALGAVILGVWRDGEPVVVGALGESLAGVPATVDMHHRTGNVGISITSTLLLQQVDAGTISLDDTLSEYFPELPGADQITVDQLVHNTTGYEHYTIVPAFQEWFYQDPFATLPIDEVIAYGVQDGPMYTPGTDWNFSDTNVLILGRILEQVTGKTVSQLAQEGIFEPLGMTGTTSMETAALAEPVLHSFTGERGVWEEATFWNPSWTSFAGGWGSNQDDIRAFIEAVGEGTLVSAESHELQLAPTTIGLGSNTEERYFGMGISIVNDWLLTAPGLTGYQASIGYLRDQKLTVVIYFTRTQEYDPTNRGTLIFEPLSTILAPENAVDLG